MYKRSVLYFNKNCTQTRHTTLRPKGVKRGRHLSKDIDYLSVCFWTRLGLIVSSIPIHLQTSVIRVYFFSSLSNILTYHVASLMTAHTNCFRVKCTVESQGSMEELTIDIHKKRSGYLIYDSKNIKLKIIIYTCKKYWYSIKSVELSWQRFFRFV